MTSLLRHIKWIASGTHCALKGSDSHGKHQNVVSALSMTWARRMLLSSAGVHPAPGWASISALSGKPNSYCMFSPIHSASLLGSEHKAGWAVWYTYSERMHLYLALSNGWQDPAETQSCLVLECRCQGIHNQQNVARWPVQHRASRVYPCTSEYIKEYTQYKDVCAGPSWHITIACHMISQWFIITERSGWIRQTPNER